MKVLPPRQILEQITRDDLFSQWKRQHPRHFLSHLFCPLSADYSPKSGWEVGFLDQDTEMITVFMVEGKNVIIKPAEEVFKKKDSVVEPLPLDQVTVPFEEALATFKQHLPVYFPGEVLGDGFLIVQTLNQVALWNFTFITKKLAFVNIKINAREGKIESQTTFTLIERPNPS